MTPRSTARATAVIAAALLLSAAVTAGGASVPPPFPNACSQFGCDARHTGRTTMLGPGTLAAPKPIPGFLPAGHSDDIFIPPLSVPPVLAPSGSLILDCRMDPMTGNTTGYGVCPCALCRSGSFRRAIWQTVTVARDGGSQGSYGPAVYLPTRLVLVGGSSYRRDAVQAQALRFVVAGRLSVKLCGWGIFPLAFLAYAGAYVAFLASLSRCALAVLSLTALSHHTTVPACTYLHLALFEARTVPFFPPLDQFVPAARYFDGGWYYYPFPIVPAVGLDGIAYYYTGSTLYAVNSTTPGEMPTLWNVTLAVPEYPSFQVTGGVFSDGHMY